MTSASVLLRCVFVALAVLAVTELHQVEATHSNGICYTSSLYYRYQRRAVYYRDYYSYWCWRRWGFGRCSNWRQAAWYYSSGYPVYYSRSYCCSGYSSSGGNCLPICSPSCSNGGSCTDPYTCTCTAGWQGSYCQSDKNECSMNTDGCSHTCINTQGSYYCGCYTGYRLDSNGRSCSDINECALGLDDCEHNCQNTVGSYQCGCDAGYRSSGNGRTCDDIDECAEGTDNCHQQCNNIEGSFYCSCFTGYRDAGDGRSCVDIDECTEPLASLDRHECDHNCHNNIGSYTCSCNNGYRLAGDGRACVDIDECAEGTDNCDRLNGNCHNEPGSFYCSCNIGYRLNDNGYSCDDIDECAENTDGCEHICDNTVGSYICSCRTGYRLDPDGHSCNDIDECAEGIDRCDQNCHNNIGSYTCSCNDGYRLNADGFACDDIDECTEPLASPDRHECEHNCHNNIGSYTCSCYIGYRLNVNQRNCDNIDECLEPLDSPNRHQCEHNCHDNIGSYTCSCYIGYRLNADGFACDDIDECTEPLDSPDRHECNQNCHNTIGSYTCSCRSGFVLDTLDGRTCHDIDECLLDIDGCDHDCTNTIGSYICSCYVGYRLNDDNHTCSDIDECTEPLDSPNRHECDQNCHNNIGSYTCSCNIGWDLDFDGRTCNDIDECLPTGIGRHGPLACHQECVNTLGSYHCDCRAGYMLADDLINCEDIDECKNTSTCDHVCTNTIGSFSCSCFSGYTLDEINKRDCLDIDECAEGMPCGQGAECQNTIGSYDCICPPGTMPNVDGSRCNDIDECANPADNDCEYDCMNTVGSYACFCSENHTQANDGISCLDKPQDVVLIKVNPRTMRLTWTEYTDGIVQHYTIVCNSPDNPSYFDLFDVDSSYVQYTVTGVRPALEYECCLAVRTTNGDSPFQCASVILDEDVPDTPPSDIYPVIETPYKVIVYWDEPTLPNGVVTGYNIYRRDDPSLPDYTKIELGPEARSYEYENLTAYQTIWIAVSANTTIGEGAKSAYVAYTTQEAVPGPVRIIYRVLSDNSAQVSWTRPDPPNGVISEYHVEVTNERTGYRRSFTKQGTDSDLSVVLTGLDPYRGYTVYVTSTNGAATSEQTELVIFTREDAPVKPVITASPRLNGENARISVEPISPDDAHGYLIRIDVAYREATSREDTCEDFAPDNDWPDVLMFDRDLEQALGLDNLTPGVEYCVAVRASTASGSSEYSRPAKVTLSDYVPIQVRFDVPSTTPCSNYLSNSRDRILEAIQQSITDHVRRECKCDSFSKEYLSDPTLECFQRPASTDNEIVYMANVLSTTEMNSMEITEHVQDFVKDAAPVSVGETLLQVNPYCNATLIMDENGDVVCFAAVPTDAPTEFSGTNTIYLALEIVGGIGGAALLALVIFVPVCIACCCCARKDTRRKYRENRREEMNVQTRRPSGLSEQALLTKADNQDTLRRTRKLPDGTLPRSHRPVSSFEPSYEAAENDDAIRKIDLGAASNGFGNPSYDDGPDDFDY